MRLTVDRRPATDRVQPHRDPPLHAALRERLGPHVRQAGSAVRPTSCASTSPTASARRAEELRAIEDRVNEWILESHPVRAIHTTRTRAQEMGAMALFGEKYGDEVRVVEVEDVSRELCGGTHVVDVGDRRLQDPREGSSAANVRRIEAVTGPEASPPARPRRALGEIAARLRTRPEDAAAAVESQSSAHSSSSAAKRAAPAAGGARRGARRRAAELDGLKVVTAAAMCPAPTSCSSSPTGSSRARAMRRSCSARPANGRPQLIASFTQSAVERGLSAADVVKEAAQVMGGGGGGRDTMAQAGGKDAEKLDEALETRAQGDRGEARRAG